MTVRLEQALQAYYGAERRRDALGLEGTEHLLQALDHPERRFRAVHVGGTNGKGSTCALIERVLRASGIRTGLFTSPHLVDFRERIRVAGRWADGERLERRLEHLRSVPVGQGRTFFEIVTALAFDAFAEERVEWAVLEVGLGGRLDCTNVVTPDVAAVTGIALDHTEILGDTLAAIAREKAGIAKRDVPLVEGAMPPAAAAVVDREARARGGVPVVAAERVRLGAVDLSAAGTRFTAEVAPWGALTLEMALRGRHQLDNAITALAVLGILAERGLAVPARAVREGFAAARWPGRLEPCPAEPRVWWDAAHNAEGAARLARCWASELGLPAPGCVVFAVSRDKDPATMLQSLQTLAGGGGLVVTRSRSERSAAPEGLAGVARELGWPAVALPDVATALRHALEVAGSGRVLLTGSLFAVGEAMEALGGAPGEWM